jgi:hypothetical protein
MEAAFGFAEEKERSPRENIFIELLHNRRGGVIEWWRLIRGSRKK